MPHHCFEGDRFFEYALELFWKAGHAVTKNPVYRNHSPERLVYFDFKQVVSLSKDQRNLLRQFSNISRLFSFNKCTFFSIVLLTSKWERSQAAHDIHTLLHHGTGARGTVCIFKCDDEVMLSFMGFGLKCLLSDWYPIDDDFDELLDRLHVVNMSLDRDIDYFFDMVYSLARGYYFAAKDPVVYELIPADFCVGKTHEEMDRDELNQIVNEELRRIQLEYGDDYVEYDDTIIPLQNSEINAELDMMLLEMDDVDEELGNPFDEETGESEDEMFDEESEMDEYEFEDLDPEIFKDPTLMVKFLEKAVTKKGEAVADSSHLADSAGKSGDSATTHSDDSLFYLLDKEGILYIDNREKGGALWIVGGHELDGVISTCEKLGFHFLYTEKGGRVTKSKPGWYLLRKRVQK